MALDSLADVARLRKEKPDQYWEDAMQAGSRNAAVYADAARDLPPDRALPLLKKAGDAESAVGGNPSSASEATGRLETARRTAEAGLEDESAIHRLLGHAGPDSDG